MENNYYVIVTTKTLSEKLKESNITFLFPLEGFSVGYPTTFKLDEITCRNAYLFINRILDHNSILLLEEILANLPSNIKGIMFDDLGVLYLLKKMKKKLETILFLNHFNCNYLSIQSFLDEVDSVVISTDITRKETEEILKKTKSRCIVYGFGYISIMYSRRLLITNYNHHFKLNASRKNIITNDLGKNFRIIENEYGTVIYTGEAYNGLRKYKNTMKGYLINTLFFTDEEVIKILRQDSKLDELYPYRYLSEEETVVRVKERNI